MAMSRSSSSVPDFAAMADDLLLTQPTSRSSDVAAAAALADSTLDFDADDSSCESSDSPPSQYVRNLGYGYGCIDRK